MSLLVCQNIPRFQKSTRAYMRQIIALQDSMIRYLVSVACCEENMQHFLGMFFVVVARFTNELNLLIDEETSHEGRISNKPSIL